MVLNDGRTAKHCVIGILAFWADLPGGENSRYETMYALEISSPEQGLPMLPELVSVDCKKSFHTMSIPGRATVLGS